MFEESCNRPEPHTADSSLILPGMSEVIRLMKLLLAVKTADAYTVYCCRMIWDSERCELSGRPEGRPEKGILALILTPRLDCFSSPVYPRR